MTAQSNARLAFPLRFLHLSKRAREACDTLGITTVGAGLACTLEEFASVPNCGEKTYRAFQDTMTRFVEQADERVDFTATDPFDDLLRRRSDAPLVRTLSRAGITTVGEFLTTPRKELLAIGKIDEAQCEELLCALIGPTSPIGALLPDELLDFDLAQLFLSDDVRAALSAAETTDVRGLLLNARSLATSLDSNGSQAIRDELSRLVRLGTENFSNDRQGRHGEFGAFVDRLLCGCTGEQRKLFERRVGLGQRAESRWQFSAKWSIDEAEVATRERSLIASLHAGFGDLLGRVRDEIDCELEAFDGVMTGESIASGTLLHSAIAEFGDRDLPLRLAAFLFRETFFHHGTFVSRLRPEAFSRLVSELRRLTRRSLLPCSVQRVCEQLAERGCEATHELVAHVARGHLQRSIEIDPELGEVFTVRASTIAERLQLLLEEVDRPQRLSDLLFSYRDRYRRCHQNVLRSHLRTDGRFLQVGQDMWSLRDRHLDELDLARMEADRIRNVIRTVGGRHRVADLSEDTPYVDRQVFLISDILRHEPCVRDLGRAEYCPRFQDNSQVMEELLTQLSRAAGEIPMSRFLENQPEHRRRLVETLLRRNRRFVSPTRDRVDLLTNYPYDSDRIRRLSIVVDQCLEEQGGYGNVPRVLEAVNSAGLGGSFLTEALLTDLLARHGRFEFLPGGIIAKHSLGLTGWIQQQAREAIRYAGESLTSDEVLVERPELAEFSHCLRELIERDPLILRLDGDRYRVA